jgi:hypothetical protein
LASIGSIQPFCFIGLVFFNPSKGGQQMKKLLVVLLVLGLAAPAMAAPQWFWYGSGRLNVGYVNNSQELNAGVGGQAVNSIPGNDASIQPTNTDTGGLDDSGIVAMPTQAMRVGAKAVTSDSISGQVEIRYIDADTAWRLGGASGQVYPYRGLYFRQIWGNWKFSQGSLRVGVDYTPATFLLYSNSIGDSAFSGDEVGVTGGIPYISSQPQIKVTIGGFQAAIMEANKSNNLALVKAITPADDIDYNLPRIELAYQWNSPMISLRPILGYQTFDAMDRSAAAPYTETSKSITSYLYGLGANIRLGAGYINVTAAGNQNGAQYGLWQTNTSTTNRASIVDGQVKDSTGIQAMLVGGFKINPMLTVEAGYAMNKTEKSTAIKVENTWQQYYLQMPITAAPGVIFTPEFGVFDFGENKPATGTADKLGKSTYFLVQARIDF